MKIMMRVLVAVLMLTGLPAWAHQYKVGAIAIHHPAANATPGGSKVAVGYMTLKNDGDSDDTLVSIAAPGISDDVQIHSMDMTDGVMKMRKVEGGVKVPAGQSVALSPTGLHVMFMGLKKPLVEGQKYDATLHFEKAGDVAVVFNIEPVGTAPEGAPAAAESHEGHH